MPKDKVLEDILRDRLAHLDEAEKATARGLDRISEISIRRASISMIRVTSTPPPEPIALEMGIDGVLRVKR